MTIVQPAKVDENESADNVLKQCQTEKMVDAVALATFQEEASKHFDTITAMQKEMIEAESLITELNQRMNQIQAENKKVMVENVRIVREKDVMENERDQMELSKTQCETNTVSTTIKSPPIDSIDFTYTIIIASIGGILAFLLAITLIREVMEKNRIAAKLSELESLPKTRCVPVFICC